MVGGGGGAKLISCTERLPCPASTLPHTAHCTTRHDAPHGLSHAPAPPHPPTHPRTYPVSLAAGRVLPGQLGVLEEVVAHKRRQLSARHRRVRAWTQDKAREQ